jgi:hypothetical protein
VWNSTILFGELWPHNLSQAAPLVLLTAADVAAPALPLAACDFARNASAPRMLAAGFEDARLAATDATGGLLVTFNVLVATPPDARCADGDVMRRMYVGELASPLLRPAAAQCLALTAPRLLALPPAIVLQREEKNWCIFSPQGSAAGELFAIYSVQPHVVARVTPPAGAASSAERVFNTSSAALAALTAGAPGVRLHNGANPVAVPQALSSALRLRGPHLLGAFHSVDARSGRYDNYAYIFSAAPPFAPTHVAGPLPLTEAPVQSGAETPRGAPMAFLSAVAVLEDRRAVAFAYGSSNVEARVLLMPTDALARRMRPLT